MRLKTNKRLFTLVLFCVILIQCRLAACYKSEIEITPAPPAEESTTKKGGFFSGFKKFFGGGGGSGDSTTTTTTIKPILPNQPSKNVVSGPQKPPALVISPLQPLGPRPDTPPSSPVAGNKHEAPQWPQVSTSTVAPNPQLINRPLPPQPTRSNVPFGTGGFQPPAKTQPSGVDLSYGGGSIAVPGKKPFTMPLATSTSTTTTTTTSTTTTTVKPTPAQGGNAYNFDLRGGFGSSTTTTTHKPQHAKEDFPALPPPRRPSIGHKEDFPALPTPKSPTLSTTTVKSNLPSAWNSPNIPNSAKFQPAPGTSTTHKPNAVAFVPHNGPSTTVRPGFENSGQPNLATDAEIMALTETLYTKENSLLSHIHVNIQGKTRSIDTTDEAPQPLLEFNERDVQTPTIEKMRLLFNNYEEDTATNEHVTALEKKEENDFVDAVLTTSVMRQAMLFLQNKGIVTPDPKTHRDLLKELWFTQYSRGGGKIGSSGFEHVFVHEVKNGTIIGFHNWVYFGEEEKSGRVDYKGYLKQIDLGNKGKVVKMRFTHNNLVKPVNGLFVGTSPEMELALYTVCFKLRPDRDCPVSLGNQKFSVVTYSWRYRGKSLIGSAFPEI